MAWHYLSHRLDNIVFDSLWNGRNNEIVQIVANAKAEVENIIAHSDLSEGEVSNMRGSHRLGASIGVKIKELIEGNVPPAIVGNVYGDLLTHSMEQLHYDLIGGAFLNEIEKNMRFPGP